ncbi:YciK family oxidoreductase [Endozoicomonas sp. (ex Bugula neritina AB1)]|nr:YciK family oxidoreductase [Endozoicomonas sp. (ex Bugula neritina AB1)]
MFQYQAPSDLLKDRIILVTGAGSGIGRTAALTFARHGATVILLGRNTEKLEAVYDEIENNQWPQPAIIPLNLETATDHDYSHLAETIENEFGKLDGLLHNAGLLGELKPVSQYQTADWERVMQVNLNAPMMMTRELLPLMRLSTRASILFTSSSVGHKGRAHWGAYSVSKFATEGLMQVMADEEDGISHVRINTINPGATRTSMRASAFPGEDPETLPRPEDIMSVYLYLMGDDSKDVSGQAFHAQH